MRVDRLPAARRIKGMFSMIAVFEHRAQRIEGMTEALLEGEKKRDRTERGVL
jgi:hypothetical protein